MNEESTFQRTEATCFHSFSDNNAEKPNHPRAHFGPHVTDAASRVEVPHYERTLNGEIEYTVAVDVQNFPPENIKVSVIDRLVTLEASVAASQAGNSKKSFRHEILLPDRVDPKQIRSVYRKDGHLVLRSPLIPGARPLTPNSPLLDRSNRFAPVSPVSPARHFFTEENFAFKNNRDRFSASAFAHSPHLLEERISSGRSSPLPHGGSFPVPLRRSSTPCAFEKYIKELHINPLFNPHDLMITVKDGMIHVAAKKEDGNKSMEYNSETPIPSNVDSSKLTAKLSHGTLILQAPYVEQEPPSYQPIEIIITNDS